MYKKPEQIITKVNPRILPHLNSILKYTTYWNTLMELKFRKYEGKYIGYEYCEFLANFKVE